MTAKNIWLSKDTEARLEALQAQWGLSRSGAIARAIELSSVKESSS